MKGGLYIFSGPTSDWRSHQQNTPTKNRSPRITRRPEQELFLRFAAVERTNQRKAVDGTAMSGLYMDRMRTGTRANHRALLLLTCINQIAVSHGLDFDKQNKSRRRKKEKEKICELTSFHGSLFHNPKNLFLTLFFFCSFLTVLVSSVALISRPLKPHWPIPTQSDPPWKKKKRNS